MTDHIGKLSVDDMKSCDFILDIHNGAADPVIYIDNHCYIVKCIVSAGEHLIVNTAKSTVTLVKADGDTVNMFRYRDKQSDVFKRILPGDHRVMWNGSYDFDITIIHERGEPKWT